MTLGEYFEKANGFGVLATTDASGQVNQAIYAKPYFLDKDDDGTCCFIMTRPTPSRHQAASTPIDREPNCT